MFFITAARIITISTTADIHEADYRRQNADRTNQSMNPSLSAEIVRLDCDLIVDNVRATDHSLYTNAAADEQ